MAKQTQQTAPNVQVRTLDQLKQKYNYQPKSDTGAVKQAFEQGDYRVPSISDSRSQLQQRLSRAPTLNNRDEYAEIFREQVGIDLMFADIAEEHGKLNLSFWETLKKNRIFTLGDWTSYKFNSMLGKVVPSRKEVARNIKQEALVRKESNLHGILNRVEAVANDIYQNRIKAEDLARQTQARNVVHIKKLYRDLVSHMSDAYSQTSDHAGAEEEVKKFERELNEIDKVLVNYEDDLRGAKAAGDLTKVDQLTKEMLQVVDMRDEVLNGQLAAEGANLEIRRQILDATEGIKVAKEAILASQANYENINSLIDSAAKQKIMYKHFLDKMVEVMQISGVVSVQGRESLKAKDALVNMYSAMAAQLDANARMCMKLSADTSNFLYADKIDREALKQVRANVRGFMQEQYKQDMQWAQQNQTLRDLVESFKDARAQETRPISASYVRDK